MKTIIYTLADPITNQIRYIGKTKRTMHSRLTQHVQESIRKDMITYKNNWIWGLIQKGLLPIIEELDTTSDDWQSLEKYWIAQIKTWGFKLTNMTDGGDGNQNQIMSLEARIKRSNSLKGRSRPEEVRNKISKAHSGKKISEITKDKLRLCNLGKRYTEESKAKKYKAVTQLSKDGIIIENFISLKHASDKTGACKGAIQNACVGRCKTAGGYKWKYK